MANVNQWFGIGRLCNDPEIRYPSNGTAICSFRLGTNYTYKTKAGEKRDEACYIDVQCWGVQAESVSKSLHKGSQVCIEGRIKFEQWEDKQTGQRRSKHLIDANRVHFLDPRERNDGPADDNLPDF